TNPLASPCIPQPATAPGFFALGDLPGRLELTVTEQAILMPPAQDKTGGVGVQGPKPHTTGVAPIKDMQDLAPPTVARPLQQLLVLIAAPTAPPATCRPPAHGSQHRWPLRQAHAD